MTQSTSLTKKGSNLTMSNLSNSKNFKMASIVVSFNKGRQADLLKICQEEMKNNNYDPAMFSLLCWFQIEIHRALKSADATLTIRDGYDQINTIKPELEKIAKVCDLFSEICEKEPKYTGNKGIDTSFFEKDSHDYFEQVMVGLKNKILEGILQIFFTNSYYWYYDDELSSLKKVINSFYKAFLPINSKIKVEIKKIGEDFLGRMMVFVFLKEGVLNGKKNNANRVARFKTYHHFLVFFSTNHLFPKEIRNFFQELLSIWLNLENYIVSNSELLKKNRKKLEMNLTKIVGLIEVAIDLWDEKNPKTIEYYITEQMKQSGF